MHKDIIMARLFSLFSDPITYPWEDMFTISLRGRTSPLPLPKDTRTSFNSREASPEHPRVVLLVTIDNTSVIKVLTSLLSLLDFEIFLKMNKIRLTFLVTNPDIVRLFFIHVTPLQRTRDHSCRQFRCCWLHRIRTA